MLIKLLTLSNVVNEKKIISQQIEEISNDVQASGDLKNKFEELLRKEESMNDQLKDRRQ